jgi:hypothetical protein
MSSSLLPDHVQSLLSQGEDTGGKTGDPLPNSTNHCFQVLTGPGRTRAVGGKYMMGTRNSMTTGVGAPTVPTSSNNHPMSYVSGRAMFLSYIPSWEREAGFSLPRHIPRCSTVYCVSAQAFSGEEELCSPANPESVRPYDHIPSPYQNSPMHPLHRENHLPRIHPRVADLN